MTTTITTPTQPITCQWTGIHREGITTDGPCNRVATLTGQQHLCTEHMTARDAAGGYGAYSYTWVWPCLPNGYSRSTLPADALRRCR